MSPLNEHGNRSNQLDKSKFADWIDGWFAVLIGLVILMVITNIFVHYTFRIEHFGTHLFSKVWGIPYSEGAMRGAVGLVQLWFVARFFFPVGFALGKLAGFWAQNLPTVNFAQVFAIINGALLRMVNDILIIKGLFRGKN